MLKTQWMLIRILMKPILTMCLSLGIALPILGQDIAAFSGTKTPETATVPNISAEALTRGPGLTVSGGPTFNSGNWTTDKSLDLNDYIEWSVTAAPGYIINITELQINFDRDPDGFSNFFTGNGPAKIRIRTSLDDFKSDIYAHDKVSNSGQSPTIETALKSAPGDTIIFRLYGFDSNIGMLGPLGSLDIEGGLGTVLGLENTGIRLAGKVIYDGLQYSDGNWTPHAPNSKTANENVIIYNGIYRENKPVQVKNLTVNSDAGITVQKTGSITVNGNLSTADNLTLQSGDGHYSSLIVTGKVTGGAKYQLEMKPETLLGGSGNERLISAPVTGETFNAFRAANPNILAGSNAQFHFGPFNNTKANYNLYTKKDNPPLNAATGYKAATSNNHNLTFNGSVQTAAVNKEITRSGTGLAEWNLIGNPYPSYVKVSEFLRVNHSQFSPASSGIYTYQGDMSKGWKIYNQAYLTLYPNAKITPGQGFMVASKNENGIISFNPHMRSSGKPIPFNLRKPSPKDKVGYLNIAMTSGALQYNTEFYFNEASSKGLDPSYDAEIFSGKAPEFAIFSTLTENNKTLEMAVQSFAFKDFTEGTTISLGLNTTQGQQVKISSAEALVPKETLVYLEDQQLGIFTLLNLADYHFVADAEGSYPGRFLLHITNATLSYGDEAQTELQMFMPYGSRTLRIEGPLQPETLVTVYDTFGRLLLTNQLDAAHKIHKIDLSILSKGMYLVKLRTAGLEKIKKIRLN